ncbi:MAG: MBL fold metallo-hydrolase [Ardenticatenaceae bacterium]|nr:MBL fold metallo-hydrolase [Ardenticatenaceae bacterium]
MAHTNEVQIVANEGWDERIVVCRNDDLVDTFIITTQRYVVVVDTMINAVTGRKLLEVAQERMENGRQLLVINTHADYDHSWGNMAFANVPIIGSKLSVPIFQEPAVQKSLKQRQEREPDVFGEVFFVPPTVQVDGRLYLDGGDLTLEFFPTPGHTVDHYALYIPEINTLLAADAAEVPYPMARTVDGLSAMRQSLAELAAMKAETVLYCHAPVTIGSQLLHDNIAYFDKLEEKCRAALARGVPPQPDEDADVIALVDCPFAEAAPSGEHWQNIHEYYQSTGHAEQIRAMLANLV